MSWTQPEPISPMPPGRLRSPLRQRWSDVVFLHWETDLDAAARWMPPGTRVDQLDGRVYVGLVCLHIEFLAGGVGVPYVGSFAEVNVRLYSVDRSGRRGIAFCSMDADRLTAAMTGAFGLGLPYSWSQVKHERRPDVTRYTVDRRWRGRRPAALELAVRTGPPIRQPSDVEHFLTARWGLHWRRGSTGWWAPAAHPPWRLHRADVLSMEGNLVESAGLPAIQGAPVSAMWSPGTTAAIGLPRPID